MDKYFTIGEISKLFNLPIKTLRYYDQIGLIKPAYINKENKYSYYSVEQFIIFDVIKYSKMMGMSLEKIKSLIDINLPLENTLNLLEKQTKLLGKRINELYEIKNSMEKVHNNISDALNYDNDVFIKYNEERKYVSYGFISKTVDELEVNLRKVVLDIQSKRKEVYSSFGTSTGFEVFKNENKIINYDIRYFIDCDEYIENYKILPKGNYLSIVLDDNSNNKEPYYCKLADYIIDNNIEVVGDFNETWIFPRIGKDKKEVTLVKIEILIK